ncbi:flavin-containing monooxygenase [Streptomyces chumphonensis]|uniref:flavin-containing monooxygenase n=1 Tax=Streptomyces chumphonensis TaxID=1214925 RepID=UPI003D71F754
MDTVEVVVIGGGQAGLSSAYHLRRRGFAPGPGFVVLDHAPHPGGAWQFRWPTLSYGAVHGLHPLPGTALPDAEAQRPSSEVLRAYFARYEETFDLPVRRPVDVRAVRPAADGRLLVESDAGAWRTRAVVNATGTWERPFWPRVPGQSGFAGAQVHTRHYPGPGAFSGRRVVVVGGGTSAVQHLLEIAGTAAETTWVTRRPPRFREEAFDAAAGRRAVALVADRVRRGLPPRSVVSVTGLPMTEEMRRARERGVLDRLPMFDRMTANGVVWDDGRFVEADAVVWATGFRPVLDHLAPLRLREPGGGIRLEGTRAVRDARVHLVGSGPSASTIGADRAGREAAVELAGALAPSGDARQDVRQTVRPSAGTRLGSG